MRRNLIKDKVMPLFGYEATRDLKSLKRNVIMHVLFPVAFTVQQVLKFWFTYSWRANFAWYLGYKETNFFL